VARPLVKLGRLLAVLMIAATVTAVLAAALTEHTVQFVQANTSAAAKVEFDSLAQTSSVYAADGTYLGDLEGVEDRDIVPLAKISDKTIKAILAVEDADFYDHRGVNARAVTRALIENVSSGSIQQGGSTITQQLVKLIVTGDDRQVADRKVTEAVLAMRVEEQYSKDEILEQYLNTVYFGGGAYGVQTAAQLYFGKDAIDLDWAESAMLAAVIRNPVSYDPTRNPELAERRRLIALERMAEEGLISDAQVLEYAGAPLPTTRQEVAEPKSYFLEEVKQRLLADARLGDSEADRAERLYAGGLQIHTTLDLEAQAEAERAIADVLAPVKDDPRGFTAALAAIEPGTGQVRAIVGGPGFDKFQFNIATQKGRPTGSAFKVYVLTAALEAGYVPNDTISGSGSCSFPNPGGFPDPYRAENFGNSGGGGGTITSQTLRSSNCAYLRLGQVVGLSNVVAAALALGVKSALSDEGGTIPLSLPLGVKDITPLDMATGYSTLANDGLRVDPIFVTRVTDRDGDVVLENKPEPQRAVSPQTARLATSVLEQNVQKGTGTRAKLPDQPAAGKTGTAQDSRDAWFVGYTPYLATAVWMGRPEGGPPELAEMRNVGGVGSVTGGSYPARIWGQFNTDYHEGREVREFTEPEKTRPGKALRTPQEEKQASEFAATACGAKANEVDSDGDGRADSCAPGTVTSTNGGKCPRLLTPIDRDGNGQNDGCGIPGEAVVPTPTTVPMTETVPPPADPEAPANG
jgi:membrane peptidoglycan carboxypeptidase